MPSSCICWPLFYLLYLKSSRIVLDRRLVRLLVGKTNEIQDNYLSLSNGDLRFGWHFRLEHHDAVATVDESGSKWSVSLINRNPSKSVSCTLKMNEKPLDGKYKATLLTGDSADSYNDLQTPDRVTPKEVELAIVNGIVDLPPHSLLIVSVPSKK
jgi:alpha-L-arabinofuranosidase